MLAKFFFAYFFKDQGKVKVEKKCNKEQGQYAAISPDQAWTINGLIIWLKLCVNNAGIPKQARWALLALPSQVAYQNTGFASSCPLADSAM